MTSSTRGAGPFHGRPDAEVAINEELVKALLDAQYPELASRSLQLIDSGWDNVMFRLGEDLALRLPRRALAAALAANEQKWLPELALRLPLPVPAPIRVGVPGDGYPWSWSIVPWLTGTPADLVEPQPGEARTLAAFLGALHLPAPREAPANPYRGVRLMDRADAMEERLQRLGRRLRSSRIVRAVWDEAVDTAPADSRVWIHGDLHPGNVLVHRGRLAAVLDWGDLSAGDAATDLACIWMLLPTSVARDEAIAAYGERSGPNGESMHATWRRARGWAAFFAVVLAESGLAGDERHARIAERTLLRLAEDH